MEDKNPYRQARKGNVPYDYAEDEQDQAENLYEPGDYSSSMDDEEEYMPEADERTYALILHLSVFVVSFLGPLVMWLIKKDESEFIDHHGREALNFSFSMMIYSFIAFIGLFMFVGLLVLPVLLICNILLPILAGIKANDGYWHRYPFIIRFL